MVTERGTNADLFVIMMKTAQKAIRVGLMLKSLFGNRIIKCLMIA